VVELKKRENRMGGAANVAMNLKAMGANPILCSVIGTDSRGDEFGELLEREGITTAGIVRSPNRITTAKFRIFGNAFQMLRVDEEVSHDLSEADHADLLEVISGLLGTQKIDCIIFQDYDKGVITPGLIREVVGLANARAIPVTVDPKKKNFGEYRGVTLFKPNLKELREGLKLDGGTENRENVIRAAQDLREKLGCTYVLTTMSEQGVMLSMKADHDEKNIFIPAG
jgi:rfaE bifunctional protein kinase chain/domain